jgi:hypothetical protein
MPTDSGREQGWPQRTDSRQDAAPTTAIWRNSNSIATEDILQFWWADPRGYYIVQGYNVGVDKVTVTTINPLLPMQ